MGPTEIDKLLHLSRVLRYKMGMVVRAIHKMIKVKLRGLTDDQLLSVEKDLWSKCLEVVKTKGLMTPTKLREELRGHLLQELLIKERIRRDIEEERSDSLYYAPFNNFSLEEIRDFFNWKSMNHLGSIDHTLDEFILMWRRDKRRSLKVISNAEINKGGETQSGGVVPLDVRPTGQPLPQKETKAYGPKRKSSSSQT